MLKSLICAALLAAAQAPAPPAETPAPAPEAAPAAQPVAAPEATASTGDNAPPALYDPVAEEAATQRDKLIKRIITWGGAAVGGVGLAVAAVGLAALGGAVGSWMYAHSQDDKTDKPATGDSAPKLLGSVLMGVGGVVVLLAAPAAALGTAVFVASYVTGGM
jgi:hypothetical protein